MKLESQKRAMARLKTVAAEDFNSVLTKMLKQTKNRIQHLEAAKTYAPKVVAAFKKGGFIIEDFETESEAADFEEDLADVAFRWGLSLKRAGITMEEFQKICSGVQKLISQAGLKVKARANRKGEVSTWDITKGTFDCFVEFDLDTSKKGDVLIVNDAAADIVVEA